MKDSEFIALLNLYLDHEISAADAARLEAEVQNNPDRRKVYQQYCRMQKACKLLATDFTADVAKTPAAVEPRSKKVVAFDAAAAEAASARRARMGTFYTLGTIAAAAACVAIIFVGRSRQAAADEASIIAQHEAQAAAQVARPAAIPAPVKSAEPKAVLAAVTTPSGPRALGSQAANLHATLVADPLLLTGRSQADAVMAAAVQQANAQFAWMHNVQLAPIQQPNPADELRFEATPATLRPEGRALGNRAPVSANSNVEMAAFQFAK